MLTVHFTDCRKTGFSYIVPGLIDRYLLQFLEHFNTWRKNFIKKKLKNTFISNSFSDHLNEELT